MEYKKGDLGGNHVVTAKLKQGRGSRMRMKKGQCSLSVGEMCGRLTEMVARERSPHRRVAEHYLEEMGKHLIDNDKLKMMNVIVVGTLPEMHVLYSPGGDKREWMQEGGFYYLKNNQPYVCAEAIRFIERETFWAAVGVIIRWYKRHRYNYE